jgi:hypothetical protein
MVVGHPKGGGFREEDRIWHDIQALFADSADEKG